MEGLMTQKTGPGTEDWIMWGDWLHQYAGRYRDWTIIAQDDRFSRIGKEAFTESLGTLSYLAKYDENVIRTALTKDTWLVRFEELSLNVNSYKSSVKAEFNFGTDDARIFVTRKPPLYDFPSIWRLDHSFEDYFDLRYDRKDQLIDPRSGEIVGRIAMPADSGPIEIRTDYLQDYLAALGMVLIRQHDHRRHWHEPIRELPERGGTDGIQQKPWGCYRIDFHNAHAYGADPCSRMTCKDVVLPAKQAGLIGCHSHSGTEQPEYPEFIVERQIDGTLVKEIPNRDKLQPFVYFDPKVLKKYYDEPSKYSVGFGSPGYGSVSDIHGWSMAVGISSEGLIFCWLGDIAKSFMPPNEVAHWCAHNVPPRGKPSESFVRSQVYGRFASQASLESKLLLSRDQLKKVLGRRGVTIYKQYTGPHRHLDKLLRAPLFNEFPEFRECIMNLATIFVDYLDSANLKKNLPKDMTTDDKGQALPSISLFANFLSRCAEVEKELSTSLISALRMIQKVRSQSGVAHSFSDKSFSEVLDKLGISSTPAAAELFLAVAEPLASAMEQLCVSIGAEELLWWRQKTEEQ
jgi:hypothetical protein